LFSVKSARSNESRFEAFHSDAVLSPLVGRQEENSLLLGRWRQAKSGEGQVVLISGEAGIGKSRLTHVLNSQIDQEEHIALRYQCSPYHVNSALYPAIEQLERAAGFTRQDSEEGKLNKMEAMLVGGARQVAEAAPLFAALLSLPTSRYPPLSYSPDKQKEKTLQALANQLQALARCKPVLMICEDIHWIDATSHEAINLLVSRLRDSPVLLILTHRLEYIATFNHQPHVTALSLNRLGRRDSMDLVCKITGEARLPESLLEKILTRADGVPLFIEELTKFVVESRSPDEKEEGHVPHESNGGIPATLRDSLVARLDRLEDAREVAQLAACIGRQFPYGLLSAIAPFTEERLEFALDRLIMSGLVFSSGKPPNATYRFKHALVQDAAYDSLLKKKRLDVHARIADVLTDAFSDQVARKPEFLAHHLTQAAMYERATPYWIEAGERALRQVALLEAIGHLTTALRINGLLPQSAERDEATDESRPSLHHPRYRDRPLRR